MSKSGSRYGRRSNWFKIHCLLQEQQQKNGAQPGNPAATNGGSMQNSFMPSHFLSNLCSSSTKHEITRSPSDSGASSADIDDNTNREGSIESFSVESKTEKSSVSSPPVFEPFRSTYSPYLNGRATSVFLPITNALPLQSIYAVAPVTPPTVTTPNASIISHQDEPMDLSLNAAKKRKRSPSPVLSDTFDIPKPAPLDLTLVRSRALSG